MPGETLFQERAVDQRPTERIAYTVDTTPYGGTPTSVAVSLFSVASIDAAGTDVSGSKLSGDAAVVGNVITTPLVISLEATGSIIYRLQVQFVCGGSTFAPVLYIHPKA
jgi:hypothetical protein